MKGSLLGEEGLKVLLLMPAFRESYLDSTKKQNLSKLLQRKSWFLGMIGRKIKSFGHL